MNLSKILSKIFFIGITVHESAHLLACLLLGVKVKKAKLFSLSQGYVLHQEDRSYKNIIIGMFPLFFNLGIALLGVLVLKKEIGVLGSVLVAWVSLASIFYALPSSQDANNVFESLKKSYTKKQSLFKWVYKILLIPISLSILIIMWVVKKLENSLLIRLGLMGVWVYLLFVF